MGILRGVVILWVFKDVVMLWVFKDVVISITTSLKYHNHTS
jgi:hypothetical protein